jgi:hypothetical protein
MQSEPFLYIFTSPNNSKTMPYKSLNEFIEVLEKNNELIRIK